VILVLLLIVAIVWAAVTAGLAVVLLAVTLAERVGWLHHGADRALPGSA